MSYIEDVHTLYVSHLLLDKFAHEALHEHLKDGRDQSGQVFAVRVVRLAGVEHETDQRHGEAHIQEPRYGVIFLENYYNTGLKESDKCYDSNSPICQHMPNLLESFAVHLMTFDYRVHADDRVVPQNCGNRLVPIDDRFAHDHGGGDVRERNAHHAREHYRLEREVDQIQLNGHLVVRIRDSNG